MRRCFTTMQSDYEEGFADDENEMACIAQRRSLSNDSASDSIDGEAAEENNCVFDKDWSMRQKLSLSSLLHSRLMIRVAQMKKQAQVEKWLRCHGRWN